MEGFLIHVRNRLQLRIEYGTYCKIEGNTQLLQIDLADWRYKASLILVALCTCWLHVLRIQWKKHGCRWLEAVWVRQITGCWQIDSVDCIISENWLDSLLRSSSIISSLVCCNLEVECNAVVYLIWMADDSHLSAGDFHSTILTQFFVSLTQWSALSFLRSFFSKWRGNLARRASISSLEVSYWHWVPRNPWINAGSRSSGKSLY